MIKKQVIFHVILFFSVIIISKAAETCSVGKYFDSTANSCVDCSTKITSCSECSSATVCTKCAAENFINTDKKCDKCLDGCQTCSSKEWCSICKSNNKFILPSNRTCTTCQNSNTDVNYTDTASFNSYCVLKPLISALTLTSLVSNGAGALLSLSCKDPQDSYDFSDIKAIWIASTNINLVSNINLQDLNDLLSTNGPKTGLDIGSDVHTLYNTERFSSVNQGKINATLNLRTGKQYKFAYFCFNKWGASALTKETTDIDNSKSVSKRIYVGLTFPGRLGQTLEDRVLCTIEKLLKLEGYKKQ
jgi:hypothetical protein